ncbi:MAG: hypothetical protein Q9187_006590, partial [Circinaria calcarea]
YDDVGGQVGRGVEWAVAVQNLEALRILLGCSYLVAGLLVAVGAASRWLVGSCILGIKKCCLRMPLGNASVAESLVVSEEETIVSLLRDISASLTSIKNQNRGCASQSAIDGCHCRCRSGISNGGSLTPGDVNAGRSSATRSLDISIGSAHQSVSESLSETVGTIYVPYGKSSPLDETTLARFVQHYNGVLDRSDVLDRLNRLPPDDFRHRVPATKGHFLRQFMSDSLPSGFTTESDIQLCLAELRRFEDFQIRLGRGHFWIRDYDSSGAYTQWDCVDPPSVSPAKNNSTDHQCEIPASEWPPEWLTRHELRPIAPWRRIMYGYQMDAISDRLTNAIDKTSREPDKYWTILLMDPVTWYNDLEDILKDALAEESSMQVAMLVLVGYALRTAAAEWQQMASYFDTLVGENLLNQAESTLLSPEKHDLLLFEDESFSRSRKYFWIVEAVTTFIDKISDSIHAWERYRAQEVDPYLRLSGWKGHGKLLGGVETADSEVAKLKAVQHQLEKHLERTKLLRDGLFNASAVIESRAASELGRNVKLLTYVSIFYLPLSFCASLWSTTDAFNLTNLAIAMPSVALATYIVVFNIERLVRHGHGLYSGYRKKIVHRMRVDLPSQTWADRAKRFDRFEPNRRSTKPSDWYVLWAGSLLLLRDVFHVRWLGWLRFSRVCPTCLGDNAQDEQDEESDSAREV